MWPWARECGVGVGGMVLLCVGPGVGVGGRVVVVVGGRVAVVVGGWVVVGSNAVLAGGVCWCRWGREGVNWCCWGCRRSVLVPLGVLKECAGVARVVEGVSRCRWGWWWWWVAVWWWWWWWWLLWL